MLKKQLNPNNMKRTFEYFENHWHIIANIK